MFNLRMEWSGDGELPIPLGREEAFLHMWKTSATSGISEIRAPSLQHKCGFNGMGLLDSSFTLTVEMIIEECAVALWWHPKYFLFLITILRF